MFLQTIRCCGNLIKNKSTLLSSLTGFPSEYLIFTRGLKKAQLFKKKKKPRNRYRDGKEYTVDHLYWENYFKEHPEILEHRMAVNVKNAKPVANIPMKNKVIDTLTNSDKSWAYASIFGLGVAVVSYKIAYM